MSNWTEQQQEAVSRSGENILVAAGAGSGKTRVLVGRVIKQILAKDNPLEIDKILVVTFTNAAAAEMRQRISKALEEEIKNKPHSTHLRRQVLLLNRAAITTLHSFCREILQKYYYLRDLDPSGRILDDTEGVLLRQEVLEEVLEEYYEQEKAGSPFYRMLDTYSRQQGDEAVQELVHRLYNFSRSQPQPEKWLAGKAADFSLSVDGLASTDWLKIILEDCALEIDGILNQLLQAKELAASPAGPEPYLSNLDSEVEMLLEIKKAATGPWQDFQAVISSVVFARLPACKKDLFNPALIEKVKKLRDTAKKSFNELKGTLFARSLEEMTEEVRLLEPLMATLVEIVNAFSRKYKKVKKEKGLLDFADLEHYALQILSIPDSLPERLLPSEAALDYQQRFREVLTDEYQDTSMVQEAILQLVSQQEEGKGNRFMVGDVKQSIYRFRLAEPSLFLQKYHEYTSKDKKTGSCIILAHNFRSRREILAGVNFLFRRVSRGQPLTLDICVPCQGLTPFMPSCCFSISSITRYWRRDALFNVFTEK